MNTTTPRVYIAATRQDEGKTTLALGLFQTLKKRLGPIGYIKPVGQRFVEVNGLKIDEDSLLMERTYQVAVPLEDMSPVTVEQNFTRRFLEDGNTGDLEQKIRKSFDRAAWEKQFVLIEGTGHAGVGSVFGLSNAHVAKLLGAKIVIVTRGGIGAPFDEVTLNAALCEKVGAEVVGVILNKVLPDKLPMIREIAERAFARLGLPVLGVVPRHNILTRPTVGQVARETGARFLHGENFKRRRIENVIVGAMASRHIADHIQPKTLVIAPGDRDDVILAALLDIVLNRERTHVAGIVLSSGMRPPPSVLKLMQRTETPVMLAEESSYEVARTIYGMTVKTEPQDDDKIAVIQELVEQYVDLPTMLARVGCAAPAVTPAA